MRKPYKKRKKITKKRGKKPDVIELPDVEPMVLPTPQRPLLKSAADEQETQCTCGQVLRVAIPHWLTFTPTNPDQNLVALYNCPRCLSSYIFSTDHPPVKTMFNGLQTVASFYTAMEALENAGWLEANAVYDPQTISKGYNVKGAGDG